MKGTAVKRIEMEDVQHEFSALCQEVASTGQAVVVTRGHEPLVSIAPLPRGNGRREVSVWGLRRQFEACHGVLTEDFALPSREIDAARWEAPPIRGRTR
jgi:antitoxin (DNA-binding transcriptional repressor) of toxin-antitoxin stability system